MKERLKACIKEGPTSINRSSQRRERGGGSFQRDNGSEVPELMKVINLFYTYHREAAEQQKQTEDLGRNQRRDIG